MSCNEKKERLIYIDIIKIIAIIGVILIHVSAGYWNKTPISSNKWEAMNVWNAIGRFGVTSFIMCSGVLFLNKKELSYKDLFCKYISRLLFVFLVWIFIYALVQKDFNINSSLELLKKGLPRAHLWFLIMIMGIYLVTPIVRIFIKNASKKDIEYFLLIAFLIQSVIPFLVQFDLFKWINNYYKKLNPTIITGYIGAFVLGYYLNKYGLSKKKKIIFILLGIVSIVSTILLNSLRTHELNKPVTTFFNNFYPNIVFYSTAIFIAIKELCNKINFNCIVQKVITETSKNILGVYLIHMLINDLLNSFNINALMWNTYISIPLVSLLIFIISLTITYIISKIPYIRRIVL